MARVRSIRLPIVLGSVSVVLSIVLLVGWILVIVQNLQETRRVVSNVWLLVAGIVSLVAIITVLVLFSVFLVREILVVRRQTSFIDSVTHELRSPLASLSLGLQTLERRDLDPSRRVEVRSMMRLDLERLTVFIEDVLEASRVDSRRRGSNLSVFPLRRLLERSTDAVARRYGTAPGQVRFAEPSLTLRTDETALETIVKNLVDNAVKYSDPPPDVSLLASRTGDDLELEVRDRGIGIPPGQLKRILERFYRVPEESVRRRPGTGLGLYVVHALVRGLGGTLSAESPGRGKGAVMRVRIPSVCVAPES